MSLLIALSTIAGAVPLQMNHQGRLFDGGGVVLTGPHDLKLTLYDASAGGNALWTETTTLVFDEGYYNVVLGAVNPLDDNVFADGDVWVGLEVDGGAEVARFRLRSVPFAYFSINADTATNLDGGTVDATSISINGTEVIDGTGTFQGTDTLSGLGCAANDIPLYDGTDWTCTAASSGTVTWGDIVGIPSDIADGDDNDDTLVGIVCSDGNRLSFNATLGAWGCGTDAVRSDAEILSVVGPLYGDSDVSAYLSSNTVDLTAGSTVAGQAILTGTLDWTDIQNRPAGLDDGDDDTVTTTLDWTAIQNRPAGLDDGDDDTVVSSLPWGSITAIPGDIANGDAFEALSCSASGQVARWDGANWGCQALSAADVGALAVNSSGSCGVAESGEVNWNGSQLEICDGTNWLTFLTTGGNDGSTSLSPGLSCEDIHTNHPTLGSGVRWIDPNGGNPGDSYEVYCDMVTAGGGWTVITANDNSDTEPSGCYAKIASDSSHVCGSAGVGADWAAPAWDQPFTELVWAAYNGSYANVTSYNYMTWSGTQNIPNTAATWFLNPDNTNQTIADWSGLNKIYCQSGSNALRSVGTRSSPQGGGAYAGMPVTVWTEFLNIGNWQMSFTEYQSGGSNSMTGLDDFQDGWGCGDQWTPKGDRGSSSYVMIR